MRHVSRTHRVALDSLFVRINLDPKIQIKYIDTKNQLADILTKGNFTRDEWNHLLCLFNIIHFSSTVCSDTMAKQSQQDSGEERVTAKSRPMMNLIARMPSVVSSSTSSNPVRTLYGYQDPGKSVVVDDRCRNVLASTSLWIFSSHRQSSTGSVVVTATCATTPPSLSIQATQCICSQAEPVGLGRRKAFTRSVLPDAQVAGPSALRAPQTSPVHASGGFRSIDNREETSSHRATVRTAHQPA